MARFRKNRLGRWLSGKREPRLEDMPDNREKARFLYRRWLRSLADRGYRVQCALTPVETAQDVGEWRRKSPDAKAAPPLSPEEQKALIELYYLARYRNDQPSDEQLNDIRRNQDAH
jgi:hypothetical protein